LRTHATELVNRATLVIANYAYLAALLYTYDQYLYPEWEYWGYTYRPRELSEILMCVGLATWGAACMPLRLKKASSVAIAFLFLLVYMPTIVIALSLDVDRIEKYGITLLAMALGFGLIAYAYKIKVRFDFRCVKLSWPILINSFVMAWIGCVAILFYFYGAIMSFVGVEETHIQRFARGDIDFPALQYLQSFFVFVICPFFMAYGLVCRKWTWFLLGASGCVIIYAVTAAKFAITLPVIYLGLNYFLRRSKGAGLKLWKGILIFSILTTACTLTFDLGIFFFLVAALFVMRTLAVPGIMVPQYHDLFSADGFTWWSHVKGFSFFIPVPPSYQNDPLWPSLGHIIGDRIYANPDLQSNANLWAGDGVAAAGALGVVAISLLLAIWLRLLDQSGRSWNWQFVLLALLPYLLTLTNIHFFTGLLTFGGLFWITFFAAIRRNGAWPAEICASAKE
jgi:hypothetical protein